MLNKKVIRIIAIVMAALMALGVFGAAISAFAIGEDTVTSAIPVTGQKSAVVPIVIGVISLVVAILCVVLAPKKKKAPHENVENDYIKEEEVENGLNFFTSKKEDVFLEKPEDAENISDSDETEE